MSAGHPDGARAIKDCARGQVMPCGTGPSVEADAIYVTPSRLDARLGEGGASLVLFDVGLGAASNALAAWQVSEAAPRAGLSVKQTAAARCWRTCPVTPATWCPAGA